MRAQHGPVLVIVGIFSALLLAGCGGGGGGGPAPAPNNTPTALAGADQTVKRNSTVTLDGSGSRDSDGDAIAYRWVQTSGTPVTLSSGTSATPTFTAPVQTGTLSFSLVTSDGKVDSTPDAVDVLVENTAPVATSQPTLSADLGSTAVLDGSASSDPDGDALTYTWTQLSGTPVDITTTAPGIGQFRVPTIPDVLVFALTVSDGDLTSVIINITVNIVVSNVPQAPHALPGPDKEAPRRSYVSLMGGGWDANGDWLTYSWVQVAGTPVTLSGANTKNPYFTSPGTPAVLRFALRVSDGTYTSEPSEVEVTVKNFAPNVYNATMTPMAPLTNDALVADVGAFDPDGDPITTTYEWRRNGVVIPSQTSNTFPASLTTKSDVIAVRMTVSDGTEETSIDATATVGDSPTVIVAQTPPPTELSYGDTASFTVTTSDADGDVPAGFEVAFGPAGFNVTPQGAVTWTAAGPLFDRVTEFNWGVRIIGDGPLLTGTIAVTDASRVYPLRRTGLDIPIQHSGLRIADLDGDGDQEMLVGSIRSVYVMSRNGSAYEQSWVYPFEVGEAQYTYENAVTAVTSGDINGDGREEIYFSKGGVLVRLDGISRREAARETLRCRSMEVVDLDSNGSKELVCLAPITNYSYNGMGRIVVLNASTLAELWSTPELGLGYTIAVGNVDVDPALEIVAAGGFVYDGATHANQWAYSRAFGETVDTGDMDADGVEEIVGLTEGSLVTGFSAVSRSPLWESNYLFDLDALVVADANGDGRVEAIIGDGQWGDVAALGYNTATQQLEVLWQINSQGHGVTSVAVGDLDGDGTREIAWGTGATSSDVDDFVVAGFTPSISVKWQSSSGPSISGAFFGGALARIGAGTSRLIFTATASNTHAIALNPATGRVEISGASDGAGAYSVDIADYDNDNIDELLLATSGYEGIFLAYDFAADSIEWQSPQSNSDTGKDLTHADMNGDGYADLIGLSSQGYIDVYDMHSQSLLWRSPRLAAGAAVTVADLDNDGTQEIIAALDDRVLVYGRGLLGSTYSQRASVLMAGNKDVLVADLNGDNAKEIYVLTTGFWGVNATLSTFDTQLQPLHSVTLGTSASAIYVEESAFARKNLLVSTGDAYDTDAGLWAIDPTNGADIWRAPALEGRIQHRSLQFIDVDGDGDLEITFGTSEGMYHTR